MEHGGRGDSSLGSSMMEAVMTGKNCQCEWKEDEDGIWHTECDNSFHFTEGGPTENDFLFCPYCGKRLETIHFTEEDI